MRNKSVVDDVLRSCSIRGDKRTQLQSENDPLSLSLSIGSGRRVLQDQIVIPTGTWTLAQPDPRF